MESVGKLVRLGADEAGLSLVRRPVKLIYGVFPKLGAETHGVGVYKADKLAAAADDVLEEAGLALVDAHGDSAAETGVAVFLIAAELVKGVAALVDNGVH